MHENSCFQSVDRISRRRGLAVLCAATAASALLCGALTNAAGASTASSAGISSAIAASSSTGASACVATATAKTKVAEAQPKFAALAAFKASKLKGKKFVYIELSNTPAVQAIAAGFSKAIASVGASPVILGSLGQVSALTQDFQEAVAQHAAGIVALDVSPSVAPAGYAAARTAKIPVIDAGDGGTKPVTLSAAIVTPSAAQTGSIQVDYALAKTHCKLHAAYVYTPAAVATQEAFNGAQAELKKLCPTNCTLNSVAADVATFQTSLSGQVQTTLQRNPDINYVLVSTDSFVPYSIQGAKAAGGNVPPIVGAVGTGLAAAIAGNGETADLLQAPLPLQGYWEADDIMRAAAGVPTNTYVIPQRMVDSKNWGTSASDAAQFPDLAGAPAAFEKAWGVKK
jgi:ribose transport system substrate-binding protein